MGLIVDFKVVRVVVVVVGGVLVVVVGGGVMVVVVGGVVDVVVFSIETMSSLSSSKEEPLLSKTA